MFHRSDQTCLYYTHSLLHTAYLAITSRLQTGNDPVTTKISGTDGHRLPRQIALLQL